MLAEWTTEESSNPPGKDYDVFLPVFRIRLQSYLDVTRLLNSILPKDIHFIHFKFLLQSLEVHFIHFIHLKFSKFLISCWIIHIFFMINNCRRIINPVAFVPLISRRWLSWQLGVNVLD